MIASKAQINYIECLLIDVGIGINRMSRNRFISDEINREISYLDELTITEASQVINRLKRIKDGEK